MKNIKTLPEDIYNLFDPKRKVEIEDSHFSTFANNVVRSLKTKLNQDYKPTLRMSNLGKPCARQLWYEINTPEKAEPLPLKTYVKFAYGDLIEEFVLLLAKVAGHTVSREQEEVVKDGIKGHIDAVVDGGLVDVKSASPYSFKKFKDGLKKSEDGFGYLTQLGLYNDTISPDKKTEAAFIAFDKVSGEICVDVHTNLDDVDYDKLVSERKRIINELKPPERGFKDEEEGKSGNRKLCVSCSYCPFKQSCWPGLQAYSYYGGPTFLTKVEREPKVERLF